MPGVEGGKIAEHSAREFSLCLCLVLYMDKEEGILSSKSRFGYQVSLMPGTGRHIRKNFLVQEGDRAPLRIGT